MPWTVGGMLAVGGMVAVGGGLLVTGLPPIVIIGLTAYTGVALTAVWRMASLDRGNRWMLPSRRLARLGVAAVALTWLGLVFGLLLRLVDLVAGAAY